MCDTISRDSGKKKKLRIVLQILGCNSHNFISLSLEVICQRGTIFFTLINDRKWKREGDDENTDFRPAWEITFALAETHERPECLISQKPIAVS